MFDLNKLAEAIFADIDAFVEANKTGSYSSVGNFLGMCVEFGMFSDAYTRIKEKYGVRTKSPHSVEADTCDACGSPFPKKAMFYSQSTDPKTRYQKLCEECYRSTIEFFEEDEEKRSRK